MTTAVIYVVWAIIWAAVCCFLLVQWKGRRGPGWMLLGVISGAVIGVFGLIVVALVTPSSEVRLRRMRAGR
jgi:hypothetical protein